MTNGSQPIQERLFALADPGYKIFHAKLMPTVDPARIIGVRTPQLRALARTLRGTPETEAFLAGLPHRYYEEDNLHGFLLERIRDYDTALARVEAFLPWIDNWATCDTTSPKVFARHTGRLLEPVRRWIASDKTYTIRYGLGMLMRYYLNDQFRPEYLEWAAGVQSEEYYVRMMVAWYFATALAKQPEAAWPWVARPRLSPWVPGERRFSCLLWAGFIVK